MKWEVGKCIQFNFYYHGKLSDNETPTRTQEQIQCFCQSSGAVSKAWTDLTSLKIQHVCQGGQLGLRLQPNPFCLKNTGLSEARVSLSVTMALSSLSLLLSTLLWTASYPLLLLGKLIFSFVLSTNVNSKSGCGLDVDQCPCWGLVPLFLFQVWQCFSALWDSHWLGKLASLQMVRQILFICLGLLPPFPPPLSLFLFSISFFPRSLSSWIPTFSHFSLFLPMSVSFLSSLSLSLSLSRFSLSRLFVFVVFSRGNCHNINPDRLDFCRFSHLSLSLSLYLSFFFLSLSLSCSLSLCESLFSHSSLWLQSCVF